MKRRDFVASAGRISLLGALALVSGVLLSRRQVKLSTDCSSEFRCKTCNKLKDCKLPEAETERSNG